MYDLPELLEQYVNLAPVEAQQQLRTFAEGTLPPAELAVNLVHALEQLGDLEGAQTMCERLTGAQPDFAPGWARQSQLALAQGQIEAALSCSETACQKDPNCGFSRLSRGIVLRAAGFVTAATSQLNMALQKMPENPVVWSHYGLCLADQFQHEMALNALDTASRLLPDSPVHASNRLMTGQYDPAASSQHLLNDAQEFAQVLNEQEHSISLERSQRLRVGYLSPDLYNHPVGRLFLPLLKAHDSEQVEITIFNDTKKSDELTSEIKKQAEHFISTGMLSDSELAALISHQPVDVLVDLAGHTAGNRLAIFAQRVAPVQISFLGYTGSTGLANMDAVILGELHCTPATQSFFVEPVMTVPGTHFVYQPPAYLPKLNHTAAEAIRFCSFNNTAKLNTEVLFCWADILKRVPDSTLTLKWRSLRDPQFASWIRARFLNLEITGERIILEPASAHEDMLERYNSMDIALDPFPYCGGLTTFEALSMGVPVVTFPWQRPVSRQSAAVMQQLGFADLVANTAVEYVDIAVNLAFDLQRLDTLRAQVRAAVDNHLRLQTRPVATGLESIYAELLAGITL